MEPTRHLVIFARYPVAGRGKRRLAEAIGVTTAVRFQRLRLQHMIGTLAPDRRWRTWLAVTPDRSGPWPAGLLILPQGRGDLGQRMARVFDGLPRGPAVLVGCDIPGVARADIAAAFRALDGHDAVFGPATDGGYWLIGLRRASRQQRPFDDVRWSSQHALADTVRNLAGARIALLRVLEDVDAAASLARQPHWARLVRSAGQG